MKLIENIFSVRNEYSTKYKYKVLRLLGIKFKFKVEKLSDIHYQLLQDERFIIDTEFFCTTLAMTPIKEYKIIKIKLKDIKRLWKGETISLTEAHPYKYLKGDKTQYEKYCEDNKKEYYSMSQDRFKDLIDSIENNNYDKRNMPVINSLNYILDGQHRCCILLDKYGEDHEIECLQVI